MKECRDCGYELKTEREVKYMLCSLCQHERNEKFIANNLVGLSLLSDNEEEYYQGFLDE
jgi:hypothetical protein